MSDHQRSWLERLSDLLLREPQDREQLVDLLRDAEQRQLLDANALAMIEGVLQVSQLQARDIMIPRSQMVVIEEDSDLNDFLPKVIETEHSRFPVIGESLDQIEGILLAKDLIHVIGNEQNKKNFNIRNIMRPAVFVPESKRLDVLLQEFRINHNHMAIVVDEYGGVAGLVTIEDILEQIVGDIADEYDIDEEAFIKQQSDSEYIVKAITPLEEFNQYFSAQLAHEECETIGGLLLQTLGHVPQVGEKIEIDSFEFSILNADQRRIRLLQVRMMPSNEERDEEE